MARQEEQEESAGVALGVVRTLRPHQWVKNLLVLAPLFFAQAYTDPVLAMKALMAAGLFSLMAGTVYLVNDVVDRDKDRRHPVKRLRPIASGQVSVGAAKRVAGVLGAVVLAGALVLEPLLAGLLLSYLVLNLAYSGWLKRVAFVDVTVISLGFVFRVLAGGVVIGVYLSEWLVVCTFLLACYMGLGKRRHELGLQVAGSVEETRQVLRSYRMEHIDRVLVAVAALTVLVYGAYAFTASLPEQPLRLRATPLDSPWLPVTIPFVVVGLARFLQLARSEGLQSPTEAMLKDRVLLINLAMWGGVLVVLSL